MSTEPRAASAVLRHILSEADRQNLTCADLGRRAGVTQTTVSAHRLGQRTPDIMTVEGYAAAVGLHLGTCRTRPSPDPGSAIRCQCGEERLAVVDSRPTDGGVRRRRECPACGRRITTLERRVPESDPSSGRWSARPAPLAPVLPGAPTLSREDLERLEWVLRREARGDARDARLQDWLRALVQETET